MLLIIITSVGYLDGTESQGLYSPPSTLQDATLVPFHNSWSKQPETLKDTPRSAFAQDDFIVDASRKIMFCQIGPLAGQVKSPGERVELNGLIGATQSSSFGERLLRGKRMLCTHISCPSEDTFEWRDLLESL